MTSRCLLVCGAHPDDETFFAGSMAKYISEGVRVVLLCGTRGERGATADLCTIDELPQVREAELRASMKILGLAAGDVHFLPYEDQKLADAPLDAARRHIVELVRSVRPQVVIGFDLQGNNGHPDHVAMSRLTSDSLAAAGDPRWYPDTGAAFAAPRLLWAPPIRPWLLSPGTNLAQKEAIDFLIDTSSWADRKAEAIRAHRTQLPGLKTLYFECGFPEYTLHQEAFRIAFGPRPKELPGRDLFEGV
jgi:LmbE family N-acetylglucosaminyl deacetylase